MKEEILSILNHHKRFNRYTIQLFDDKLKDAIYNKTSNCTGDFSERIYWILNDIVDYPHCTECDRPFKPQYSGLKHGYRNANYCSYECCNGSKLNLAQKSKTYFEKTGYYHPSQNPEWINNIEKEREARTGFKFVWQCPEIKKKIEKTLIEKTGYSKPMDNPETKIKKNKTMLLKYGVEHSMQHEETFIKNHTVRTKKYILPSGKEINFQGYEDVAIQKILETEKENDFETSRLSIPKIWYFYNSKRKRYFPDIFLKSKNLIIEVKSQYTFKKYREQNLLKANACISLGFKFEFWICDSKKVIEIIEVN